MSRRRRTLPYDGQRPVGILPFVAFFLPAIATDWIKAGISTVARMPNSTVSGISVTLRRKVTRQEAL
jgi:hypothetical protein